MWRKFNPNPLGKKEPDCVIRAICGATGKGWFEVYDELCAAGREACSMPSANSVWGQYLDELGYEPFLLPESCPRCITVKAFCRLFPRGTYIIGTGTHAVCVRDGDYLDAWDSGNETPEYFWKVWR